MTVKLVKEQQRWLEEKQGVIQLWLFFVILNYAS